MPDSFSELRGAGGSNKPWIAAGVSALAVALVLIALAGAYWSARPEPESSIPATVTVTALPPEQLLIDDALAGTYTGTLVSLDEQAKTPAWPAVATFGGGTASITYPQSGCTALIDGEGFATALTKRCPAPGGEGRWRVDKQVPGIVHLTYSEGGKDLVEGELSLGLP
ncbi:hypothetical protein [Corynebacterium sp. Marseille-P4321]|uniref:hypothetical protein n=1 Tax=Corynebacterium sp. Marseille-P4321 TaxID=2736603 RepID=UPI0015885C69|nr:hypothetical protein [Corynebacterium sp. Marseille-P4321]